ncbi:MAG: hypothetical protein Q8O42_22715 [Acidobacteriota bacterium]|nr:hypothetical protein [Acidobacteriota bacterium]
MITDLIVGASLAFTAAFVTAWWLRPGLRAWIERPKHQFHDAVRGYDRAQHPDHPSGGSHAA